MALLFIAMTAGSARAATYPAPAGSSFNGGLEGWKVTNSNCTLIGLPLLCTAETNYDASQGNPAGSLVAKTSYLLNLVTLFRGEAGFESPDFTVSDSGAGVVALQRAFYSSDLVKLNPQVEYTVSLVDKTVGSATKAITETIAGESAFTTKQGTAPLIAGHTYAIQIAATTSTSVAELGITGSVSAMFDNISVTTSKTDTGGGGGTGGGGSNTGGSGGTGGSAGGGATGGNGGGSGGAGDNSASTKLSNSKLLSLLRKGAAATPVGLRGNRLFVKVNCPAKIGRACKITAQGMLNRHRAATNKRVVKVGKGKGKRIVLQVKRKAKKQVAKRKRLLMRQNVRAGKAHATIYKSRKLMRKQVRR